MIGLIKAEWYKLLHTGILKYFIVLCFIFPVTIMMADLNWYKMTLSENIFLFAQNTVMMMPMFLSLAISVPIGLSYQSRTAYYEIMDGRKTCEIIFSKVILYTLIFVAGITVTCGAYFGILGAINGLGNLSDIPLRFMFVEIIIIRICTVSVLISMLIKHIIGLAVSILRFMILDNLLLMLTTPINAYSDSGSDLTAITAQSSSNWFISGQMTKILSADIDSKLIIAIFITFIIEFAIWYVLTYISYKHKKFK